MKKHIIIILSLALIIASCSPGQNKSLVTQKIQYDVSIKSPDSSYDPWIQNIGQTDREKFVSDLMNAVYEGRVQAYDYFNRPMSLDELNGVLTDTAYRTLTRIVPPYEVFDTVIVSKIEISDINKIRFLEEWYMDDQDLVFEKVVIGIAPVAEKYDEEGNFIGLLPLFWIYPEGMKTIEK